eukprot:1392290-Amorphochlora_amoeboformis.AAC.1
MGDHGFAIHRVARVTGSQYTELQKKWEVTVCQISAQQRTAERTAPLCVRPLERSRHLTSQTGLAGVRTRIHAAEWRVSYH